jgi:tRNA1Val (adenine37-N6)-methyltransferase
LKIKAHETIDTFLNGELRIIQSRQGYRFSVDALLLAEFAPVKREAFVVDLGAGCGIISLFLAAKREVGFIVGLELQEELVSQAQRNITLNGLEKKVAIIQGDLRHSPLTAGWAHVVVCNPPYKREKSGRINPHLSKAIARHEITASLDDILVAGRMLLKPGGKLAMICPANRLTDVFAKMRTHEMEPKRLQIIFPNSSSDAKLAMVEGRLRGKSGLKILPPVFGQGGYSI